MNDIPAPYDNTSGQRTMAQAMRELCAFRATRQTHDLSVLKRRSWPTPNETEPEKEVNPLTKKRSKRWVEAVTE